MEVTEFQKQQFQVCSVISKKTVKMAENKLRVDQSTPNPKRSMPIVYKRQTWTNVKCRLMSIVKHKMSSTVNLFCLGYCFGSRPVPVARRWVAG